MTIGDILLKPIVSAGGTDISHWFNTKTKDVGTICKVLLCNFLLIIGTVNSPTGI